MTIDNLPEDVLLEIFDAYRQDVELLSCYEETWNSRDGWFKLAHVCPRWRRLVHLSPTRLHVHLLFTPRRSSRATVLKRLPLFPILVDYRAASWTEREENLALAALSHRSRVRGIAFRTPCVGMAKAKLLRALCHPFPELESLEICPSIPHDGPLILPVMFLSGSAPHLRRLTLRQVAQRSLSPLLSFATGLVELTLIFHTEWGLPREASLLQNLQRMSCLRHLELNLIYRLGTMASDLPLTADHSPPIVAGDVVSLSKLTHLLFTGHRLYLQALVVGLAAPSLQYLDAKLFGQPHGSFPIPHLCKFICDSGCQFTAIHLVFSRSKLKFHAATDSQSIDDRPFKMIIPGPGSLEQMGQELSGPLSTVKELSIALNEPWFNELPRGPEQWRGFFYHVPQVKMVQVSSGKEALNVAHSFQLDGGEPAMDLLPALEQTKVDIRYLPDIASSRSDLYASIRVAFEPLITARNQVGCPIMLLITGVDGVR